MKKILAMALCLVMMMAMAVPAFAATTVSGEMGWTCGSTEENHVCEDVEEGYPSCYVETGLTHSGFGGGYVNQLDTDYTIDVVGKLDADNDGIPDEKEDDPNPIPVDPTIAVDVYWTDMEFNYQQSWDEVNLVYIWTWQNGEDYIQVDNRSSVGVNASVTFTGANGFADTAVEFEFDSENAVAATWESNTLTLKYGNQATAEELAADPDLVVTPSGTLNVNVAEATTMTTGDGAAESVTLGQITINVSAIIPPPDGGSR